VRIFKESGSPALVVLVMVEALTKQLPLDMPGPRERYHMLSPPNRESPYLCQYRKEL